MEAQIQDHNDDRVPHFEDGKGCWRLGAYLLVDELAYH